MIRISIYKQWTSQVPLVLKNRECRKHRFHPWVGKIPWSRKWQPTPVLPGKFCGQRSLASYRPWGHRESDTTEWLSTLTYINNKLYLKTTTNTETAVISQKYWREDSPVDNCLLLPALWLLSIFSIFLNFPKFLESSFLLYRRMHFCKVLFL